MCGIAGFLDKSLRATAGQLEALVTPMSDAICHRGPDDHGAWVDAASGLALGFRRLAILDLSPTGRQPMLSADGRYVLIFNGEVYNFSELRPELEALGNSFRGGSDSEVMLAAISQWGLEAAVKRFDGMFAFALWDRRERLLHLVRDRLGIKPLYYGWNGDVFLFGSELKALRAHPAFDPRLNRDALALYLRHSYVPAPHSIYRNIFKLLPGAILTISASSTWEETTPRAYWSAREIAERGVAQPFEGAAGEAIERLDVLLRASLRLRMVADVPLGAFLSGGVDSSTLVALMQAESSRPVETFTIGFTESEYNEAVYAKEIAGRLGTKHTELYITPAEAQAVIPRLPFLYDEPFADASQIPTFLVAEMARRYVTVCLSGDGGDELFAGYTRHTWVSDIWRRVGWLPRPGRAAIARMMSILTPVSWQAIARRLDGFLPSALRQTLAADKAQKLANILALEDPQAVYYDLVSQWKQPARVVTGSQEPPTILTDRAQWADIPDITRWMMYLDLVTYLPDDILAKVDRASMAVSLEARTPYLDDHRVVEFAWRLPLALKIKERQSKWILRQVLYRYVPKELIERPKMGFAVPIDSWLRGPLREWSESLLNEERLRREGIFEPQIIRRKWQEHLAGKHNWQYDLWTILMFQTWLEASPCKVSL